MGQGNETPRCPEHNLAVAESRWSAGEEEVRKSGWKATDSFLNLSNPPLRWQVILRIPTLAFPSHLPFVRRSRECGTLLTITRSGSRP